MMADWVVEAAGEEEEEEEVGIAVEVATMYALFAVLSNAWNVGAGTTAVAKLSTNILVPSTPPPAGLLTLQEREVTGRPMMMIAIMRARAKRRSRMLVKRRGSWRSQ